MREVINEQTADELVFLGLESMLDMIPLKIEHLIDKDFNVEKIVFYEVIYNGQKKVVQKSITLKEYILLMALGFKVRKQRAYRIEPFVGKKTAFKVTYSDLDYKLEKRI